MDTEFIVVGICVAALFAWAIYQDSKRKNKLAASGIRTYGTVIRNKICWGRIIVVRPIIEFQTADAQTIVALDKHGTAFAFPRFSKGQKVLLVYDPVNPTDFDILSSGSFG
ncbi:DUF3592 domain-containing protein [Hymenobacter daeguensis]